MEKREGKDERKGAGGGTVEVDFISSLTMGKGSFVERDCGTAFPLCTGGTRSSVLRLVSLRGKEPLGEGEASRRCHCITMPPSPQTHGGYAGIGAVFGSVTIPIPA